MTKVRLCRGHLLGGFSAEVMVFLSGGVRASGQLVEEDVSPVAEPGDGEDSGVQPVEHQFLRIVCGNPRAGQVCPWAGWLGYYPIGRFKDCP